MRSLTVRLPRGISVFRTPWPNPLKTRSLLLGNATPYRSPLANYLPHPLNNHIVDNLHTRSPHVARRLWVACYRLSKHSLKQPAAYAKAFTEPSYIMIRLNNGRLSAITSSGKYVAVNERVASSTFDIKNTYWKLQPQVPRVHHVNELMLIYRRLKNTIWSQLSRAHSRRNNARAWIQPSIDFQS